MEGPWKHIGDTRSVPYNGSATEKPRISEMIVARKKHRSSMEGCGLMQVYWNSHVNNTEAPWEFICLMDALKNPLGSYTAHGAPMETPLNSHKGRKEIPGKSNGNAMAAPRGLRSPMQAAWGSHWKDRGSTMASWKPHDSTTGVPREHHRSTVGALKAHGSPMAVQ